MSDGRSNPHGCNEKIDICSVSAAFWELFNCFLTVPERKETRWKRKL